MSRNVYAKTQKQQPQQPHRTLANDPLVEKTVRVMSAQRLKNNDLRNRITELGIEMDKLREENKLLKRVHHREEIAIKRLESQDTDLNRIVKNHMEETTALKDAVKAVKAENRKLSGALMEKDEEIRAHKKRNEDLRKILTDKKLLDSVELSRKLEVAEKDLAAYKSKSETLEKKLEMLEKHHKHEIGVEIARHKDTQRKMHQIVEENKEIKGRLEVTCILLLLFSTTTST